LAVVPASAESDGRSGGGLPKIHGFVKPHSIIGFREDSVPAGRYKVIVSDTAPSHNFHMTGPGGVDRRTLVAGMGKEIWKLDLLAGTYVAICDPHKRRMKTEITVT
jgi:hypothetical protein